MFFTVEVNDEKTNSLVLIGINARQIADIKKEGDNAIHFVFPMNHKFSKSFPSEVERDTYFNYMVDKLEVLSLTQEKTYV